MAGPDPDVFISFAEEDAAHAELLQQALTDAGLNAWVFTRDDRNGKVWDRALGGLWKSKAIVFVISRYFLASQPCKMEVERAFAFKHDDGSALQIVTAVVIDNCEFKGPVPSDYWMFFSGERHTNHGRPLNAEERATFARNLARDVQEISPSERVDDTPQVTVPAILTHWSADHDAVTIRVAKEHPRSRDVRECLIHKLRLPSADGSWVQSRESYVSDVVPALETILGRGCCPNLP